MGRIGEIVERKAITVDGDEAVELTVDLGAGDVITVLDNGPAGVNTYPRVGDLAIITELDGAEEYALVGIVDVSTANAAGAGEVYLYSRDTDGALASYVHVKNNGDVFVVNENGVIQLWADGRARAANSNGNWQLAADGEFTVNGHLTVAKV